jgi:hypothetical protein
MIINLDIGSKSGRQFVTATWFIGLSTIMAKLSDIYGSSSWQFDWGASGATIFCLIIGLIFAYRGIAHK